MIRNLFLAFTLLAICVSFTTQTLGQKKDKDKKAEPTVKMVLPLGTVPGQTVKFTIRGLQLDKAEAIHFASEAVKAKILSKGKSESPDKNPQQAGDTQMVVEVTVPQEWQEPLLTFEIDTPEGKTAPHAILIESNLPVMQQKEPNEGFQSAQKVPVPVVIDGTIDRVHDVDVYAFEGKAGEKIVIEVLANRHGSALDPMLTLYDEKGQQIAFSDDLSDSLDSRLEVTLPRNGTYYIALIDAHDRGGQTYPYRLVIRTGD